MSSDRLRQPRVTASSMSAPPPVPRNQLHSTIHGPRFTPDVVASLQRTAGNHAVSSKLTVQRDGGTAGQVAPAAKESGPTSDEAHKVFKALDAIWHVRPKRTDEVDARDGLLSNVTDFQSASTEAAQWAQATMFGKSAEAVPSNHRHVLHLWYAAARGVIFVDLGPPRPLRGPDLLKHIHRAEAATQPFVNALKLGDDFNAEWHTEQVLKKEYFRPVGKLVERAHRETAETAVKAAAKQTSYLAPPEQMQQAQQAKRTIADAIVLMSRITSQVNNLNEIWLDDAFKTILAENSPPGPVGDKLAGMKVAVAASHINEVLGALKAIVELTDPEQKKKLFDDKMTFFGYAQGSASLMEHFLTILQGTISGITGLTAVIARALGHAGEATKLLAHSRKITGRLGTAAAALSVAKGVATLFNDDASADDKLHGTVDAATGLGSIYSKTRLGPYGLATQASFELWKWSVKSIYGTTRGVNNFYSSKAIHTIKKQGTDLADYGNRVMAASRLLAEETDPTRKKHLAQEYGRQVSLLRIQLQNIVERNTTKRDHLSDPGFWEEMRTRFEGTKLPQEAPSHIVDAQLWAQFRELVTGIGPPPDENTPIDSMMKQAHTTLKIMSRILDDYEEILHARTLNSF